jgi:hypothetical protein
MGQRLISSKNVSAMASTVERYHGAIRVPEAFLASIRFSQMILRFVKPNNTAKGYFVPVKRLNHNDLMRRAVALSEYEAI